MIILYCYDKHLDYYDWFICRNSYMVPYRGPSDSYWLVPGTFDDDERPIVNTQETLSPWLVY